MQPSSTMVIATWRPVPRRLKDWVHEARRFKHIATTPCTGASRTGVRLGRALWGLCSSEWSLGICWEWAEVRPGIVTLTNPMHVHSNVALLSDTGERLDDARVLLELNNTVHSMNWQREVYAQVRRRASLALAG